jgi:proliferating cell nuclear antigen
MDEEFELIEEQQDETQETTEVMQDENQDQPTPAVIEVMQEPSTATVQPDTAPETSTEDKTPDVTEDVTEDDELPERRLTETEIMAEIEAKHKEEEDRRILEELAMYPGDKAIIELDTRVLKDIMTIADTITEEIKISCNTDGIELKLVDPAHVAMVKINIPINAFVRYELPNGPLEFGIDVIKILDVLKIKAGTTVTMDFDKSKLVGGLTIKTGKITKGLLPDDISGMRKPKFPKLDLPTITELKTEDMTDSIKLMEQITDHVQILVNDDGITMTAKGETSQGEYKIEKTDCTLNHAPGIEVKSLYSLDYLKSMIKTITTIKTKDIILNMGDDYPMKIDGIAGPIQYSFLLAPRIEND